MFLFLSIIYVLFSHICVNQTYYAMRKREDISVLVIANEVKSRIITLRNQPVLIDADVAELYGVQTKEVNQAVRNNQYKFPQGYTFLLNKLEKEEVVKSFDHLKKLKFSKVVPTAFTERGLYMLETYLKVNKP